MNIFTHLGINDSLWHFRAVVGFFHEVFIFMILGFTLCFSQIIKEQIVYNFSSGTNGVIV